MGIWAVPSPRQPRGTPGVPHQVLSGWLLWGHPSTLMPTTDVHFVAGESKQRVQQAPRLQHPPAQFPLLNSQLLMMEMRN